MEGKGRKGKGGREGKVRGKRGEEGGGREGSPPLTQIPGSAPDTLCLKLHLFVFAITYSKCQPISIIFGSDTCINFQVGLCTTHRA